MQEHDEEKQYVLSKWDYNRSYNKSLLGFWGFVFESVVLILLELVILNRIINYGPGGISYRFGVVTPIALTTYLVIFPMIYFWIIWHIESKKLRKYVTKMLNCYRDTNPSDTPRISPFHMRHIPVVALALVAQVALLIFFAYML